MNCHTCERELNKAVDRLSSEITEGLNLQQAFAAVGRGQCVEFEKKLFNSQDLDMREKIIFGPEGFWQSAMKVWNNRIIDFKSMIPIFRIVPDPSKQEEPKRSLTYAEALECEKVRIEWPEQSYGRSFIYEKHQPDGALPYWLKEDLHDFDLADRRGYFMERVD